MSSPPPVPSSPPAGTASAKRGCWKGALIGCGVVAVVLVAGFVALAIYARRNPGKTADLMMKQIETHYAPDVTAEEKEQLRAAYNEFRKALEQRRVSRAPLDRLRGTLLAGGSGSEVTREQVRELTREFREAAGFSPAPAPPSTPPADSSSTRAPATTPAP